VAYLFFGPPCIYAHCTTKYVGRISLWNSSYCWKKCRFFAIEQATSATGQVPTQQSGADVSMFDRARRRVRYCCSNTSRHQLRQRWLFTLLNRIRRLYSFAHYCEDLAGARRRRFAWVREQWCIVIGRYSVYCLMKKFWSGEGGDGSQCISPQWRRHTYEIDANWQLKSNPHDYGNPGNRLPGSNRTTLRTPLS